MKFLGILRGSVGIPFGGGVEAAVTELAACGAEFVSAGLFAGHLSVDLPQCEFMLHCPHSKREMHIVMG